MNARYFAIALLLLGSAAAQSSMSKETAPTYVPVTPYHPSPGDHVGFPAWGRFCSEPIFDGVTEPQVRRLSHTTEFEIDFYRYELTYRVVLPNICFGEQRSDFSRKVINVGPLPRGFNTFVMKGIREDGTTFVEYETEVLVREPYVRADASGVWYSPEQNGRGVTVALVAPEGSPRRTAVVYWATHDAKGDSAWNVLATEWDVRNVIEGTAVTTSGDPLRPGSANLQSKPFGQVRFEYQRCGHATLTWDADDDAIEDGSLSLVQTMQPLGVYVCDVKAMDHIDAAWVN